MIRSGFLVNLLLLSIFLCSVAGQTKNLTFISVNGTDTERGISYSEQDRTRDRPRDRNRTEDSTRRPEDEELESYDERTEDPDPTPTGDEEEDKFVSNPDDITLEHLDFVQLRLTHIARQTTANITELRLLQKKEFKVNSIYKEGWEAAISLYNVSRKERLFEGSSNTSVVQQIPEDYHIALVAYTLGYPSMYSDFNRKTREVCSGKDIDKYTYKSYFKLLLLAIQALGKEPKFRSGNRFLYRGVGSLFSLEVGQVLAFQHFASTSASLRIAENFADKTLFEFQGPFQDSAVSIREHSQFEHEEEVLFSPLQTYQVESKHEGKYYTRYVLVGYHLPSNSECNLDMRNNYNYEINKIEGGQTTNGYNSNQLKITSARGSAMRNVMNLWSWGFGPVVIGLVKFLQMY